MPGFIHHPLLISLGEGEREVITRGMILHPAEGTGLLEILRQVGFRGLTISKIDGVARAVFGIPRWCRHLSALFSRLIPFRRNIKKDRFLKVQGAVATQEPEINAIGSRRIHHRIQGFRSINMQFDARLKHNQIVALRFQIREVTQQPTIRIRTFPKTRNLDGLRRLQPRQKLRDNKNGQHTASADKCAADQQTSHTISTFWTLWPCTTGHWNVLPLMASRGGDPNQGADACCFDRKGGRPRHPPTTSRQ